MSRDRRDFLKTAGTLTHVMFMAPVERIADEWQSAGRFAAHDRMKVVDAAAKAERELARA